MLWVDKIPAQSTFPCYFSETILGQKYFVESFELQNLRLHFFNTPHPHPQLTDLPTHRGMSRARDVAASKNCTYESTCQIKDLWIKTCWIFCHFGLVCQISLQSNINMWNSIAIYVRHLERGDGIRRACACRRSNWIGCGLEMLLQNCKILIRLILWYFNIAALKIDSIHQARKPKYQNIWKSSDCRNESWAS